MEDPDYKIQGVDDPLFGKYLGELRTIFPDLKETRIRGAILKFKSWTQIIEGILQNESVEAEDINSKTSPPQPNPRIATKATKYEGPCGLYLPTSLLDVDLDLEHFGSFTLPIQST